MRTRSQKFSTPLTIVVAGATVAGSLKFTDPPVLVRALVVSLKSFAAGCCSPVRVDVPIFIQFEPSHTSHTSVRSVEGGGGAPGRGLATSIVKVIKAPAADKASRCAR